MLTLLFYGKFQTSPARYELRRRIVETNSTSWSTLVGSITGSRILARWGWKLQESKPYTHRWTYPKHSFQLPRNQKLEPFEISAKCSSCTILFPKLYHTFPRLYHTFVRNRIVDRSCYYRIEIKSWVYYTSGFLFFQQYWCLYCL